MQQQPSFLLHPTPDHILCQCYQTRHRRRHHFSLSSVFLISFSLVSSSPWQVSLSVSLSVSATDLCKIHNINIKPAVANQINTQDLYMHYESKKLHHFIFTICWSIHFICFIYMLEMIMMMFKLR